MEDNIKELFGMTMINLKQWMEKLGNNPTNEEVSAAADQLLKECIAAVNISTEPKEEIADEEKE
jgi:hypothetical protein